MILATIWWLLLVAVTVGALGPLIRDEWNRAASEYEDVTFPQADSPRALPRER
jgi:hypothetical protein